MSKTQTLQNRHRLRLEYEEPTDPPKPTPLLFVHGMCHGAWCWQEHFLPFFAQHGYLASALDLQGHGGSSSPKRLRSISVADFVPDVARAAKSLPSPDASSAGSTKLAAPHGHKFARQRL